jgi:hypothetical protein
MHSHADAGLWRELQNRRNTNSNPAHYYMLPCVAPSVLRFDRGTEFVRLTVLQNGTFQPYSEQSTSLGHFTKTHLENLNLGELKNKTCSFQFLPLRLETWRARRMQGIFGEVMAHWAAQNERNASSTSNIDAWWASTTQEAPEDAYKRLIDACRLAVEEAYMTSGDLIGSYAEGAGGDDGAGMRFFHDFLITASRLGLMPPWWTSADVTAVKKLAKDPQKGFCIMHAQEVSDVRETWGAATTLVLRSLASRVYSAYCSDYSEDDGDDDQEDEDNYDGDDPVDEADATMTHWCGLKYDGGIPADYSRPKYKELGRRSLHAIDHGADDERKQFRLCANASSEAQTIFREITCARAAKAEAAKAQGNAHVARKEWREAAVQYSTARRLDPRNEIYHSNYSHACLELAKQDTPGECSKWSSEAVAAGWCCVYVKSTWAKGYSRLGAALAATGQPGLARQVYKDGMELDRTNNKPNNKWWRERLKECDNMEAMLFHVCETVSNVCETVICMENGDTDRSLAEVASLAAGQLTPEAMAEKWSCSSRRACRERRPSCSADLLGRPNIWLARVLENPENSLFDELKAADVPALVATLISIRCAISAHALNPKP